MSSTLWEQCIRCLSHDIEEENFNTWIRPLQVVGTSDENNKLTLLAPNQFVLNKIKKFYLPQIESILKDFAGSDVHVSFAVGSNPHHAATAARQLNGCSQRSTVKTIRQEGHLIEHYNFETFVIGPSNKMALNAAKEVSSNRHTSYNPLFIRGGVGLGKTHLLHAIGNHIAEQHADRSPLYLHSVLFVRRVVKALCGYQNRHTQIEGLRTQLRAVDVLLVDDIQMLKDKQHCQEEFFHLFNALIEDGKQIIFTSDVYPQEMSFIDKRLQSRFSSGLLQSIGTPELETKIAILQQKGRMQNICIETGVAHYIARKIHTIRALEGALQRLKACSEFHRAPITLKLAQDAIADLVASGSARVSVEQIQHETASFFQISVDDLSCSRRFRSLVRPRQLAMYLCKKLTNKSLPEIGAAFGGRDHTTVIYACRKVKELLAEDPYLCESYKNIESRLQMNKKSY